jgi:hypothetical protein
MLDEEEVEANSVFNAEVELIEFAYSLAWLRVFPRIQGQSIAVANDIGTFGGNLQVQTKEKRRRPFGRHRLEGRHSYCRSFRTDCCA